MRLNLDILCEELVVEPDTLHSCTELNRANSVCEFRCDIGMKLDNGVDEIACQDLDGDGSGDWSNTAPDCICLYPFGVCVFFSVVFYYDDFI